MMPLPRSPARWPWLLACCLAGAAAWFWFALLAPAEAQLAALQRKATSRADIRPAVRLTSLAPVLPRETSFPDVLGRIAGAAAKAGIPVDEANYQVVRLAQERTVRYEITLPLHLTYAQLRTFLDELHAALPAMGVENVQLQRQKVGDEALDARLKLALLMEARQ
ncbi:MAG: GspMb/PilO family protein [Telluria sp.]